jgi:hypothetical protein
MSCQTKVEEIYKIASATLHTGTEEIRLWVKDNKDWRLLRLTPEPVAAAHPTPALPSTASSAAATTTTPALATLPPPQSSPSAAATTTAAPRSSTPTAAAAAAAPTNGHNAVTTLTPTSSAAAAAQAIGDDGKAIEKKPDAEVLNTIVPCYPTNKAFKDHMLCLMLPS